MARRLAFLLAVVIPAGPLRAGDDAAPPVDCPVGKGHVVLLANNPMWRWQTHGSHALVWNAILNWDHLDAGRPAPAAQP